MGKALSVDLRRRVVAAIEGGLSTREATERFSVSKAAAGARACLKRATGDVVPKPHGSPEGSSLDVHEGFIDRCGYVVAKTAPFPSPSAPSGRAVRGKVPRRGGRGQPRGGHPPVAPAPPERRPRSGRLRFCGAGSWPAAAPLPVSD